MVKDEYEKDFAKYEFEYPIPVDDAYHFLELYCGYRIIIKTRYHIIYEDKHWELDIFDGLNKNLAIAEVELASLDEEISIPPWVYAEITGIGSLSNHKLAIKNEKRWKKSHPVSIVY